MKVSKHIYEQHFYDEMKTNFTSLGFPIHCKLPSTKIPNRSHRCSASSIECAETFALGLLSVMFTKGKKV